MSLDMNTRQAMIATCMLRLELAKGFGLYGSELWIVRSARRYVADNVRRTFPCRWFLRAQRGMDVSQSSAIQGDASLREFGDSSIATFQTLTVVFRTCASKHPSGCLRLARCSQTQALFQDLLGGLFLCNYDVAWSNCVDNV